MEKTGKESDMVETATADISKYRVEELITHGIVVSNLSYKIAQELGCDEEFCKKIAMAGIVHDIGKIKVYSYIYRQDSKDSMNIEKMRYIRMHSEIGYDILQTKDFDEDIARAVLYHHENFDGSGYPSNLVGENIPLMARILRVCDVFAALTSDRVYRNAFDVETAIELMIDEVKNFDMKIFLTFLTVVNCAPIEQLTGFVVSNHDDSKNVSDKKEYGRNKKTITAKGKKGRKR